MSDQIEGTLYKNKYDRYELDNHEFTSGSSIQVYYPESGFWLVGRVEHSRKMGGYYFYSDYPDLPSFPLKEGMRARVGFSRDHFSPWMIRAVLDRIGSDILDAARDKVSYPGNYREEVKKACKRLEEFLKDTESVPFLNK